ncbi:hypothetical protein SAMN05892883_1017 [Jatrophihabitans sp. GAS493]|uniref:hypothetical protein n=1 Tax=Jatrophihabitans sp. GAS493 TaxID=1907575 RepID=UPI000BB987DC|nr:hypothetical protein [Jatrophihabitans sp. GAS493]SOD71502.1 hypothetical protein SAMN05892883_1017 [Jatrophihabitans sp. GAS493]
MTALMMALSDDELAVVRETESSVLSAMNEDELVDLHTRVRRARTKYVGQYRRAAAERVAGAGGRGKARPANRRAADKAEIFEAALAKVSTALAKAARSSAAELKAERLAAARAARGTPATPPAKSTGPSAMKSVKRRPAKSSGRKKRDASSIAAGARRQAARDAR